MNAKPSKLVAGDAPLNRAARNRLRDALLASETFRNNFRSKEILSFLFANFEHAASVSERELAANCYGGSTETQSGKIRVAMHQLRAQLRKFFATEGIQEPLILDIPKGNYTLRFLARAEGETSEGKAQRMATVTLPGEPNHLFVGRRAELASLAAALQTVCDTHRSQLVCVTGEAGIGKTTLVTHFLHRLAVEQQLNIADARCVPQGGNPYLPIYDAITSLLQRKTTLRDTLKVIAPTWLPVRNTEHPRTTALASRLRVGELRSFFEATTRREPLVLFIDNFEAVDPQLADFLTYLTRDTAPKQLLTVVAYRESSMRHRNHDFLEAKATLELHGVCQELSPAPLTRQDIAQYLDLRLPTKVFPAGFANLITQKSEGHPLILSSLIQALLQRDSLTLGATKQLFDELDVTPNKVERLILTMIGQLSDADQEILAIASLLGHEFESAILSRALGEDPAIVEQRLARLASKYCLITRIEGTPIPDGTASVRYRFVHVLYREVLYDSLGAIPARKMAWAKKSADALLYHYGPLATPSQLGFLLSATSQPADGVPYLIRAAESAITRFAYYEAATTARNGLQRLMTMPTTPTRDADELRLLLALGYAIGTTGGYAAEEVHQLNRRALELTKRLDDRATRWSILHRLWMAALDKGVLTQALEIAQELLSQAALLNKKTMLRKAHHALASTLVQRADFLQAHEQFSMARALMDTAEVSLCEQDPFTEVLTQHAHVLWLLGHLDTAVATINEALRYSRECQRPDTMGRTLVMAAHLSRLRGDPDQTREYTEEAVVVAGEYCLEGEFARAKMLRGWALAARGDCATGLDELHQGLQLYRATGSQSLLTEYLAMLAETLNAAGRRNEALNVLEDAATVMQNSEQRYFAAELYRRQGEILLVDHSDTAPQVYKFFLRANQTAKAQHAKYFELLSAMSFCRLALDTSCELPVARRTLMTIYESFTEGCDTAPLQEARLLLHRAGHQETDKIEKNKS